MEKERLPMFFASSIVLSIATTHIIFHLSLLVPLAATVSFDLSNFDRETKVTCSPNHKGICLQGDAFLNQGLQLTKNQVHTSLASSVGRAVYSQPVHIWDSATRQMTDFTTQFSFIIHDVDPRSPSGDGLAFFLSSYPSVIPNNSAGGFLGLFPNSSHSDEHGKMVAIEFDTYPNSELDSCSADHIGINVNSIRSVMDLTLEGGIKKRTIAKARVQYSAKRQTLSVTLTYDDDSLEGNSNLSHVMDLRDVLPEYVSIGFSAATGSMIETHNILSWSFDSNLDTRGSGTATLLVLSGVLMVGVVLALLLVLGSRKAVVRERVDNIIKDVTPLENNGEKKDEYSNVEAEYIKETRGKEEVTGLDTVLTAESGQGLVEDEDVSLDGISLEEVGGSQNQVSRTDSETSTRQEEGQKDEDVSLDGKSLEEVVESQNQVISSGSQTFTGQEEGQKEEEISLDDECLDEDGHGITESEKITKIHVQPSHEREGGTNLDDVSPDDSIVEGEGSHIEEPIAVDLSDRWSPKEIPYHVLLSATNNFSEEMMLGKGGFGPVYRGFLSDLGLDVAIKKLSERSEQGMSEYMAEVKIITQLRHRNLVKLIGWCHEHAELMLVYEFMPNGSLDNHLFKEKNLLEWSARCKIALGLANALMYLHDECEPYVLHRDVKSSNVLLDSKFDAKLADFGLARLFNCLDVSSLRVTHPAGTRGYWAPEYALMSRASTRSDVYSYGVVALEIACGRKAILTTQAEDGEGDPMLLVEWVWDLYGKGAILDAADKRLNGNFDHLQMERLLIMGLWCAHPDHRQRPSIRQASNALRYPEAIPLPTLPARMPPWAFPLSSMQMVQLSPMPLPSTTLPASDDSMSSPSQHDRHQDRDLNTFPEPTLFRKLKRRLFARFTWWLKRKKATSFDETLDNEIRMVTGLKEFSYIELVQATDNFSSMLGQGGFGRVYKGQLVSGMKVAVKSFSEHHLSIEQYMTEVMTLSRLAHRNLLKPIGLCHEPGEYLIVYEYMANGTLDRHLFGDLGSSTIPWEARYKVVLSLASVVCFLHNDWEQCVLHRDIKPNNLYLDEGFNVKLGDFALAKQTDHGVSFTTSRIAGTHGYMAPEYAMRGKYTTASDVYSFGVVALVITCGRRPIAFFSDVDDYPLMQWVWQCYAKGNLLEASDKKLMGNFDSQEMERLMVVGLWCAHYDPAQRPQMAKVLRVLLFEEDPPALLPDDPALLPDDGFISTIGLSRTPSVSSACDSDIDACLR